MAPLLRPYQEQAVGLVENHREGGAVVLQAPSEPDLTGVSDD